MGLLDRLRQELVDIVEWIDHTRDTLVWRFPRYRNEIKNGAQLIILNRDATGMDSISDLVINDEIGPTLSKVVDLD